MNPILQRGNSSLSCTQIGNIYLQMDRSPRYRSISIQIQISRYISRSILLRARGRYLWIHLSLEIDMSHIAICTTVDLQGTFLKSIVEEKKKRIHMHVHIKTIPNDFLMILQQRNGGHLAKSLCLCEIMQKRIPTDTRKSHFPTRGRRETGFVSKEKNLCQIPSATLLQAHKRIKFSHLHRVKLFFSY